MRPQSLAFIVLFVLAILIACKTDCYAEGIPPEWRKAVVLLQPFRAGEHEKGLATGFLYKDYTRNGKSVLLVTCKHVLISKDSLTICFNAALTDSSLSTRLLPVTVPLINRNYNDTLWVAHPDPDVDVAVLRFSRPDSKWFRSIDNIVIGESTTLTKDSLYLGLELGYWGFPKIFGDNVWPAPLLRMATVAETDCFYASCFFVEAWALPGNSGSPVFRKEQPQFVYKNGELTDMLVLQPKLAGIISAYRRTSDTYLDYEGRPAVRLPYHSGIAMVYTFDAIQETIDRLNHEKP